MLNSIIIMGRLTRDPELRRTGSGIAVASFSVAVDRDYTSDPNGEKETDFINCVAWRQKAEFVSKYFEKGSMIVVSGRLQIRKWTDNDGNNRTTAEIVADSVYFADNKKKEGSSVLPNPYASTPYYQPYSSPFNSNGVKPAASTFNMFDDDDDVQLPF